MVNTKRYDINYTKLVMERIPFDLLEFEDVKAFAFRLVAPIVRTFNQLITFRNLLLYKISITPQVCYLEKMLNNQYDTTERRIYIEDGSQFPELFIFQEEEDEVTYLFQESELGAAETFLFTEGEGTGDGSFDFVVYVPNTVPFDFNEMTSLIDNFKLDSKRFAIQTFAE